MNENENLVTEEVAENVEQTTEETPKTYTEAEFNAKLDEVIGKKIARKEAKIRKEYDKKYSELEEVLRAGTGKESVGEITDTFKQFYAKKGITIPQKPTYTDSDIATLAKADAAEIISAGDDEVIEELDRLTEIGAANMTPREKAVFKTLAEHRNTSSRNKELAKMGVSEDVYNGDEFKKFAAKYKSDIPVTEVFEDFRKMNPQKEFKTTGSMKNSIGADGTVKDYYTRDEAVKFTKADLDKNPALVAAIERSMLKW